MSKHWKDSMQERNKDWMESREKPKEIVTKIPHKKYHDGWERIFGDNDGTTSPTKKSAE